MFPSFNFKEETSRNPHKSSELESKKQGFTSYVNCDTVNV